MTLVNLGLTGCGISGAENEVNATKDPVDNISFSVIEDDYECHVTMDFIGINEVVVDCRADYSKAANSPDEEIRELAQYGAVHDHFVWNITNDQYKKIQLMYAMKDDVNNVLGSTSYEDVIYSELLLAIECVKDGDEEGINNAIDAGYNALMSILNSEEE